MSYPVYYPIVGDTLPHLFDSFDGGTGASITMTGLAATDIEVYKDGSVTQRASDNGYVLLDTDGIDFDGITGIHGFSIDLNDNSDSGFYAVGPWYHVVISAITIDGQTINFVAYTFRILSATRGMAGTSLPDAVADAAGGVPISDTGGLNMDGTDTAVAGIQTDLDNATDGLSALKTLIDALQTDLDNGTDGLGALKTLIDTVNTDLSNGTDGLGALKTLIDALNDLSASEVNAEVVDVIDTDVSGEPAQGAPPVSASLRTKTDHLYKNWRNRKRQSATLWELYADNETTVDAKATVSDNGTVAIKQEIGTGP